MKRITKIEIQNFQSHKNTTIEPTPGLTVIVGHTDSGKSAFIRALRWCLYNKQPKSQLINKDADFAAVKVTFDDNSSIYRYKSKNKKDNYYIVTDSEGTESTFTSVGNAPLKEVMDISGMYEVNMFNRDISLSMTDQFDSLFFLAENPTDKGTLISQMANTEVCDAAISICSAKINVTKKLVTSLQKSIKTKRESLAEYNYLEELKNVLDALNKSKEDVLSREKSYQEIELLQNSRNQLAESLKNMNARMINISDIEENASQIEDISAKLRSKDVLASCCNFVDDIDKIARCLAVLNSINSEDFVATEEKINALLSLIQAQQALITTQSEILNSIARLSQCLLPISLEDVDGMIEDASLLTNKCQKVAKVEAILREYENDAARLLSTRSSLLDYSFAEEVYKREYQEMLKESEICPVCGSKMDEEHLHTSIKNL